MNESNSDDHVKLACIYPNLDEYVRLYVDEETHMVVYPETEELHFSAKFCQRAAISLLTQPGDIHSAIYEILLGGYMVPIYCGQH